MLPAMAVTFFLDPLAIVFVFVFLCLSIVFLCGLFNYFFDDLKKRGIIQMIVSGVIFCSIIFAPYFYKVLVL